MQAMTVAVGISMKNRGRGVCLSHVGMGMAGSILTFMPIMPQLPSDDILHLHALPQMENLLK